MMKQTKEARKAARQATAQRRIVAEQRRREEAAQLARDLADPTTQAGLAEWRRQVVKRLGWIVGLLVVVAVNTCGYVIFRVPG